MLTKQKPQLKNMQIITEHKILGPLILFDHIT